MFKFKKNENSNGASRKPLNKKVPNKNKIPGFGENPLNLFTKIANAILIIIFDLTKKNNHL